MSSVIDHAIPSSAGPLVGRLRAAVAWLGEGIWLLGALVLAVVAVAFFVLVMELPSLDGSFIDALKSPINLVRMGVLASATWLWSYIHRAVRGVPARH